MSCVPPLIEGTLKKADRVSSSHPGPWGKGGIRELCKKVKKKEHEEKTSIRRSIRKGWLNAMRNWVWESKEERKLLKAIRKLTKAVG